MRHGDQADADAEPDAHAGRPPTPSPSRRRPRRPRRPTPTPDPTPSPTPHADAEPDAHAVADARPRPRPPDSAPTSAARRRCRGSRRRVARRSARRTATRWPRPCGPHLRPRRLRQDARGRSRSPARTSARCRSRSTARTCGRSRPPTHGSPRPRSRSPPSSRHPQAHCQGDVHQRRPEDPDAALQPLLNGCRLAEVHRLDAARRRPHGTLTLALAAPASASASEWAHPVNIVADPRTTRQQPETCRNDAFVDRGQARRGLSRTYSHRRPMGADPHPGPSERRQRVGAPERARSVHTRRYARSPSICGAPR